MYSHSYSYSSHSSPIKYREDIQCIVNPVNDIGGIYVGNLQAAENLNTLKQLNIKAMLTAAVGVYISHPKTHVNSTKYVPAQDKQTFNISQYFDDCGQWIKQNLQTTNILIHCLAGVSRSVSLLLAYLIKHQNMTYQQAYNLVKKRRRIIHPNSGFVKQLKQYQANNKEYKQAIFLSNQKEVNQPKDQIYQQKSPNILKYLDQKQYSNIYRSPNITSRGKSSTIKQKSYQSPYSKSILSNSFIETKKALTRTQLDEKVQEIKRKYLNKSEYAFYPKTQMRQHSSYKQTISKDPFLERDLRLSKYFTSEYKKQALAQRYDRMINPQLNSRYRLNTSYVYSSRF